MDGLEQCIVKVSDIVEFPTELGNRCSLLQKNGLNSYWNTEEEIFRVLIDSAADPVSFNLCLKNSRCRKFYEIYNKGRTPFSEKDPIRLLEYKGQYWASEGKHRVCMAKRAGVKSLEAFVYHLPEDTESLLPHEGEPGHFHFSYSFVMGSRKPEDVRGTAAYLWIGTLPGTIPNKFGFRGGWLNASNNTDGVLRDLFPGLQYRISARLESKRAGLFSHKEWYTVESEVIIGPDHPKTKIWLLEVPAAELPGFCLTGDVNFRSVYRFGCWRIRHLKQLSGNFFATY